MKFGEKLIRLRRKNGMSQEQLAAKIGITRQSVSKWESGSTLPELAKLIAISELFDVSVDYLVKDSMEEDFPKDMHSMENTRLEEKMDELSRYVKGYQFTSKCHIRGIPLVSIRLGRRLGKESVAKGIIAIGNIAIGVVSFGAVSIGVFSFGALALGIIALGALAAGLVAFGAFAVGVIAIGTAAVGIYAGGVTALGKEVAVGVAASGKTAIGETAGGHHCLLWNDGLSADQIRQFLDQTNPNLWEPLRKFFIFLGQHIK
nr:helix-turn-helix transcriptional regulator [uncultured Anaerostipes sp.]